MQAAERKAEQEHAVFLYIIYYLFLYFYIIIYSFTQWWASFIKPGYRAIYRSGIDTLGLRWFKTFLVTIQHMKNVSE